MFNKIDGDFDNVVIRTFKVGLPAEYGLRKSLTGKLTTSVCQLIDRINKDFAGQSGPTAPQIVNTVFREPVHQVLEKIKDEPYFKWPNKMRGDPMKRNQSLHCQYHQEQGHTTENYRTLWNHLEQLVRDGRLKHILYRPNGQGDQAGSRAQGNASSRPPLGTINVIFVAWGEPALTPPR
ncbi:uncharacterized protein LOC136064301 [Quercus suber]|uniref:uncharacterized protein LOC136064301 n=1 Tax=Quercus suber TaxID=58331 RepID=UPI0032DE9FA3